MECGSESRLEVDMLCRMGIDIRLPVLNYDSISSLMDFVTGGPNAFRCHPSPFKQAQIPDGWLPICRMRCPIPASLALGQFGV
jgi:hypothetical protein